MDIVELFRTHLHHRTNLRRSREELAAQRLAKFRKLATHAATRSPYYSEIVHQLKLDPSRAHPEDFPPLTKAELMANFDAIATDRRVTREAVEAFLERSRDPEELLDDEFYVVHTSGSSGEVGLFVYSQADWARGIAHALRMNPATLGKRRLAFYGAAGGHYTGVTLATSCRKPLVRHAYEVAVFEINSPFGPTVQGLNDFQPTILMGYASALALLAERQKRGELRIHPRWVQSSGEGVQSADRELIEEAFGVPLLNVYSCTEHLLMGWGHPDFDGMYLLEDDLIFELEPDHTLVTNLFNFTVPLIRYRMNDVLREKEDPNPLLPFRKVEEIVGRKEHIPFFRNERGEEDFISPHTINEFLAPNLRRFQLQVTGPASCIFRVCLEPGLTAHERSASLEEIHRRLRAIFAQKGMANVEAKVEEVEDLLPDPRTGKFRLIVPREG